MALGSRTNYFRGRCYRHCGLWFPTPKYVRRLPKFITLRLIASIKHYHFYHSVLICDRKFSLTTRSSMSLHRTTVVRIINQTPDFHGAGCLSLLAWFLVQSLKYSDWTRYHYIVWQGLLHQLTIVYVITSKKKAENIVQCMSLDFNLTFRWPCIVINSYNKTN